ncbi:MAG: hypothetical protein RMI53_04505 [Nitrososphaerota archaeon]|nr:hypothetical protein [Nitrososphaerota archaeon]
MALIIFITYIVSFIVGIFCIFLTPQGILFQSKIFQSLRLNILYFQSIRISTEINALQIFLILHLIFAISFLSCFFSYRRYPIFDLIWNGNFKHIKENFLILMPAISSSLFIMTLILHSIFERVGIEVGGPSYEDPLFALISLSYATISEEIGFRLIPILIPIGIYVFFKSKAKPSHFILAILKPRMIYSKDGTLNILQFSLIFISALQFSYAHIAFEVWNIGKIPSSFIAGIVIGFCAVRYGFDAAILIHWYFNYYWYVMLLPKKLGYDLELFNFSFALALYTVIILAIYFISLANQKLLG